jgi:serine/threonine-protein kinase
LRRIPLERIFQKTASDPGKQGMSSLLKQLKDRKLVQWGLAYLAGAWVLYEVVATIGGHWDLPNALFRGLFVVLVLGFFFTVVLAWYHGEQGRQRVSGPELLILAMLFAVSALGLSLLARLEEGQVPEGTETVEAVGAADALLKLPGIAVLPFVNSSGVPEDQYFVDGFHDELLTRLQRTDGLRVIGRQGVEAYRGSAKSFQEIGRELRVEYILEGRVQRAGNTIRVHLQLVDAPNGDHFWADNFDRTMTDAPEGVLEIQTELVRAVAGELNVTLHEEELERAARRSTRDPEAYDFFIRGLDARRSGTMAGHRESAELLKRALERDPTFSVAYAEASVENSRLYQHGGLNSENAKVALDYARRANELDPESEDAQLAMGVYFYRVERDYAQALDWIGRAASSLRGDFEYHRYRAYSERRMGRWRASLASLEAALALSPGDPTLMRAMGINLMDMRRYDEAEERFLEAAPLEPATRSLNYLKQVEWLRDGTTNYWQDLVDALRRPFDAWELRTILGDHVDALSELERADDFWSPVTYRALPKELMAGWSYEALGDSARARREFSAAAEKLEGFVAEYPSDERFREGLALAHAGLGNRERALQEAQTTLELRPLDTDALAGPHFLLTLASVQARFGETQEALALLERLLTIPSRFSANSLRNHYLLRPLHNDPAFQALVDREPGRVF